MHEVKTVSYYMTTIPGTIAPNATLAAARTLMNSMCVRHLPVTEPDGKVVGILSERDLFQLTALHDVDFHKTEVAIGMTPSPYCVRANAAITEVAEELAARRISCAVVVDCCGHIAGIFTEADAVRALADEAVSQHHVTIKHADHRH